MSICASGPASAATRLRLLHAAHVEHDLVALLAGVDRVVDVAGVRLEPADRRRRRRSAGSRRTAPAGRAGSRACGARARAASGSATSGRSIRIEWRSVIAMSCGRRGPGRSIGDEVAHRALRSDDAVAHVRRLHAEVEEHQLAGVARPPSRAPRPRSAACRRSPPGRASRASPGRARTACPPGTTARAAGRGGTRGRCSPCPSPARRAGWRRTAR